MLPRCNFSDQEAVLSISVGGLSRARPDMDSRTEKLVFEIMEIARRSYSIDLGRGLPLFYTIDLWRGLPHKIKFML